MALATLTPSALLLLQTAGDDAARPEFLALRPLLIGLVVLGLVLGVLRYLWRSRRGPGGRG